MDKNNCMRDDKKTEIKDPSQIANYMNTSFPQIVVRLSNIINKLVNSEIKTPPTNANTIFTKPINN